MATTPEKALESLEGLKHPKEQLNSAIQKAKDTIVGSGSIKKELATVKNAVIDTPKEAVVTPLKSLDQLVHLHPIDATEELASGAGNVIGNLVKVATSPARLGIAGVSAGAEAVKAVAKMPVKGMEIIVKSPFYVWNTINRGADKIFGLGSSIWSSVDKKIDKIVSTGKAG